MAASPGGEEDSVYDTGRLSLFDLILEKTRAQNKVITDNLVCFFAHPFLLENIMANHLKVESQDFFDSCRKTI